MSREVPDPDEVVAYTVGSFRYCPKCAKGLEYSEPTTRSNLMDVYTYHCDECGKSIV